MSGQFADCWFLTGPTASGKSELALALAERLGAEILALDSMTLYRGMDIGTSKPTSADQARVPHHLIDLADPGAEVSVDWYLRQARRAADVIRQRGRQPLFVGGTPLYLKAALRGLFDGPAADPAFRKALEHEAALHGTAPLHQRLGAIDPIAAGRIHPGDLRRITRALEVHALTGRPISAWQSQFARPATPAPPVACLLRDRQELYARIDERVVRMLDAGWIEETRGLVARFGSIGGQAAQAVGYASIIEHLAGRIDRAQLTAIIQTRTRQFCKRQLTWFRHLEELTPFPLAPEETFARRLERLAQFFVEYRKEPSAARPSGGDQAGTF